MGLELGLNFISNDTPWLQIARVRPFGLSEGVDQTGVTTKILTFNCTLNLIIDNNSKLFGLHVRPPIIQMSFGRLRFATSRVSMLKLINLKNK